MQRLLEKIREILRNRRIRMFFTRVVSLMAAIIVFVTTYALVLPAITLEKTASCGIEEHQHNKGCYELVLTCDQEESEGHHHDDSCYTVTRELECDLDEHQHSQENGCYDEEGNLICDLPEHVHDDSCYKEIKTLTCGQEESKGHHHTDACYEKVLVCGKEAHTHSKECYKDGDYADGSNEGTADQASSVTMPENTAGEQEGEITEEEPLSENYVPELDPLNMEAVFGKKTGFYYFHAEEGQEVPSNSAEITDWKKVKDETELEPTDLVKMYLPYTIPAGSLNETNPIARYRLPENIHLTDDQIKAINKNENGIAAGYSESDPEYRTYLGVEAIEGDRTPDELLRDGAQEYISAVVRAEDVYENDEYIGQDLIFTFVPYTIEQNQTTYDAEKNPVSTGKKITGWFACDFRLDQIDWIEEEMHEEIQEDTQVEIPEEAQENIQEEIQEEADQSTDDTAVITVEKAAEILFVSEDKEEEIEEIKRTLKLVEKKEDTEDTVSDENETEEETAEFQSGTLTADGDGYKITLDYTEEAKIPENAFLSVREITAETDKEAYEACLAQAQQHVDESGEQKSTVDSNASRFFDIEIQVTNEDGTTQKIEPAAPVSVNIQIADAPADNSDSESGSKGHQNSDPTVLHFAEEGVEQIEATTSDGEATVENSTSESGASSDKDISTDSDKESNGGSEGGETKEIRFEAESFSIYGVVYTVDFHWEVNGKMYEFSMPGGGFVSFTDLVEVLDIIGNTNSGNNGDENEAGISENDLENGVIEGTEESGVDSGMNTALTLGDVQVSEATRKFVADVASLAFSNPELVDLSKVDADTTVGQIKEKRGLECEYSMELTEDQIAEINAQNVEAGDWALISVHPFLSNESLIVTMKDGGTFTICVTDGQIKKTVISASGETYEVIVTYGEDAHIPDSAELRVKEIHKEEKAYTDLQKKAGEELSEQLEKAIPSHPVLFDIAIYDGETEIEPAEGSSVQVEIRLVKGSVTGTYTDQSSPLLINDEPVNADKQEITQKLQIIHDVKEGTLEAVDVMETTTEEKIVGQFETSSFSNWLLFLDEDLTDITVYKGDSITLRPYGEWYWKKDGEPEEIQNLNWTFPGEEYNTREGTRTVEIDYAWPTPHTQTYTGIVEAKTKDGKFTFNGYAKYDRELHEYYWYYHAPDLQPGDFTIYVVNDKGETRTIRVHVLNETGHENDKPGTVSGVDNIAVNLFDYDLGGILDVGPQWVQPWGQPGYYDWNDKNHNLANDTNFDNTTINTGHDLKFLSSGSGGTATGYDHGYNGYYSENVHPGIVKNDLTTEGYPELAYGTDLKYLFDTSKTSWVDGDKMIAYPNVTGLFRQDARGYYYFNSNINYAYYNPANGNKQFTLYEHTYTQSTTGTLDQTGSGENAKPIGFFPFHDYDSTHNLNVNQNNNLNHHLGMSMKLQFDIPQDKKINGEDIVFEFSGDDDLWVFVDGKLVLDMGGIHQPVPGTINFSGTSNNVKVYGQSDKSVTFAPGYHTMEVFYLERGGCDSNCSIMFNMPLVIGRGDFKVVKKGENTENVTLGGAVFGLWETEDCSGDPVRTATSKTSGSDRGLVEFNNLSVKEPGQVYYMKEISAPNGYVKKNKIYTVTASNSPGPDGKYTFTIQEKDSTTPLDTIEEEPYTPIVYNLKQKPRNISLQKTWQNEYGETIPAPSGAIATFKLHKKGYYSAASTQERTLYKVQLQNLSAATLAQGFFYEGDKIRLVYEFDNSPINTTMSLNGEYYANLIKQNSDTGPRYVEYTVNASDADNDNQIIFKRENDANGYSHGFKTKEWELVEAAPVTSEPTESMEDRIIQTFTLPYNGQWTRTFANLDTYDAEGNPFMYWFEETGTTNANGFFSVTVNDADHPLEIDQTEQVIKNLKKAAIKIIKVSEGTETPISGAGFTLKQVNDEGYEIPNGINKPQQLTGDDGILIFDGLEPGRYELAESKIPDGYIMDEGPYYIVVNDDYTTELEVGEYTLITQSATGASEYTVKNTPGASLPNCGGPGTHLYTILGTILIAGAGLLLWRRRRTI